jgi:Zn-finger nucleic acid-binding protein
MVELDDLASAINDLTSLLPSFEWKDEQPGTRPCPQCAATMTTCKLLVQLDGSTEHPKPVLDRCAAHGVWFDHGELAMVFEKIATKGFGGAIGRKTKPHDGVADQGRSAFKERSGRWGGY